jgi:citrate synthase
LLLGHPVSRDSNSTRQFTSLFAIAGTAATAGWLVHWREQVSENRMFRPTQVYTGYESREYVPVEKRQ